MPNRQSVKATARITYDIPRSLGQRSPQPGDFLRSISRRDNSTLTVYLIVGVREVRRRKPCDSRRFVLTVQRGYSVGDIREAFCWRLHWNTR